MLTKNDIKLLKEVFTTKDDLKKFVLKEDLKNFATKDDLRSEISGLRSELKSDILTFKDEILREVVAMRQELSVVIGYRDRIEDHEVRIKKLEKEV